MERHRVNRASRLQIAPAWNPPQKPVVQPGGPACRRQPQPGAQPERPGFDPYIWLTTRPEE